MCWFGMSLGVTPMRSLAEGPSVEMMSSARRPRGALRSADQSGGQRPDPCSSGLYDQVLAIVLRHKKASTSYIQRRLQIGYNRAASIMERMEKEGVVGPANHAGKREIPLGPDD